jgi:hypothetical protein
VVIITLERAISQKRNGEGKKGKEKKEEEEVMFEIT